MKVKLKRSEILSMYNALANLPTVNNMEVAFTLAVNKNVVLKPIAESIQEQLKPSKEYTSYERERIALCEEFSQDENGEVVKDNNNFLINEGRKKEFYSKLKDLKHAHKSTIDNEVERLKGVEDYLKKEQSVDLGMIPKTELTSCNVFKEISVNLLACILPMIDGTQKKIPKA